MWWRLGGWRRSDAFRVVLVNGRCWLQVLPLLDLVAEAVFLGQVLDLSCKMLPWYVHDVDDDMFVFGGAAVLCVWVVCEVEVGIESNPYFVQGCEEVPDWSHVWLVGLVYCVGCGGSCLALLCVDT